MNAVCYKCNNYPNIDTDNPFMRNCATCTAKDACVTCATGYYLINNKKGCVSDCSLDTSVTGKKYINAVAASLTTLLITNTAGICMVNCSLGATVNDLIDATKLK